MKLDNQELEMLVLAHIVKSSKSMDKLIGRQINKDHFDHINDGDKYSYTSSLFKLIHDYYVESGGNLFTELVLDSKMDQHKVNEKTRAKIYKLWTEIQDFEIDENDFHELTSKLKNKRCNKILSDMLFELNEKYNSDSFDNTINIINSGLESIQKEKLEYGSDRHNFDITKSSDFFREEYNKRVQFPELFKGIDCGISNIDSKTFGWLPGQIVVFLAPSSGGKSVMLLNSAVHANRKCNKKVLYMSFEMNSWLCLLRHISLQFDIPYNQLKNTDLKPDDFKKIVEGLSTSQNGAYFEYDVNMEDPTPEYIDSRIKDLIASKGKPDLLVIDYIGNMTVRNASTSAKDYELQTKAIQQLFIMAKRYNIPIITAQQINREGIRDARKAKENNKSMFYDQAVVSGGQVLMHLCTYAIAMEPNKEKGYCILHPVKMRDAWFHPFPVAFDAEYNKIKELSEEDQQTILSLHQMSTGAIVTTTNQIKNASDKTPINTNIAKDDDDEELIFVNQFPDEEIDLCDWVLER